MNDQVAVGYLTGGLPEAAFVGSFTRLIGNPANNVIHTIQVISGPKIDKGRNQLVERWLDETHADYLLMVDDDMVLPIDTAARLMRHRKDIIGGLCFSVSLTGTMRPSIFQMVERDDGKPALDVMFNYPTDQVIQADGVGGACMMISRKCAREVKKAMGNHPMPWFAHGLHNGVEIGEDASFCLRAAKVGFSTWVDTGLEIPHIKPATFGEVEYVRSLMSSSHPYYDRRDEVPIYQELTDGSASPSPYRSSPERLSSSIKP